MRSKSRSLYFTVNTAKMKLLHQYILKEYISLMYRNRKRKLNYIVYISYITIG